LNIAQFRSDPGLVAQWADELKNNRLLQLVLEAIENGHPARHAMNADANEDISPTRASIELGVTRGYSMVMERIRFLAMPIPTQEGLPQSEYSEEEKDLEHA
jgi:hypothetical protein